MFNSNKVVSEYGISGLIMPYVWLLIYIFFHHVFISFWFINPSLLDRIGLIVHAVLTVIAIIFSHQVLFWAAKSNDKGTVAAFFAAIIRKMTDSPIELLSFIIKPWEKENWSTGKKVAKFIYNILYVLISIFFGYIIFIVVSIVYGVAYYVDRNADKSNKLG